MPNLHHFKDSKSIKHCDYHENTGTLEIGFTSGSVYHYPDCPRHEYENLKKSESAGTHFHQNIRKYKSIKVK